MGEAGLTSGDRDSALAALAARRAEAEQKGRIDNSSLYAGSPMYYYCKLCGLLASVMREDWDPRYERPKSHCDPCQAALNAKTLTPKD